MKENPYLATCQLMSQQNATVFPTRLIVLLAILVLLVLLIMIMFCSFASQEVPGPWRSGEYFFELGKGSESSTEEAVPKNAKQNRDWLPKGRKITLENDRQGCLSRFC